MKANFIEFCKYQKFTHITYFTNLVHITRKSETFTVSLGNCNCLKFPSYGYSNDGIHLSEFLVYAKDNEICHHIYNI